MAKRVFYSFHYEPDNWRVSQVRNIGSIEGNKPATDNDWETVKSGKDPAIEKWIREQLYGRSCTLVMIGSETAHRKWIDFEIVESWNSKKGLVGIHIHGLKDRYGFQSAKGANPFSGISINNGQTPLSSVVQTFDPPYSASTDVYSYISQNLESWIDKALAIRAAY